MLLQDLVESESRWPNDRIKKLVDDEFDIDHIGRTADKRFKEHDKLSLAQLKKLKADHTTRSEWKPNTLESDPMERYQSKKEADLVQMSIMARD